MGLIICRKDIPKQELWNEEKIIRSGEYQNHDLKVVAIQEDGSFTSFRMTNIIFIRRFRLEAGITKNKSDNSAKSVSSAF